MRATVLWASDGASIILTFHHAIVDALSGTRILHDVMRALAGQSLKVLPQLPPVEEMIAGGVPRSIVVREGYFSPRIYRKPAAGVHRVSKSSRQIWQ